MKRKAISGPRSAAAFSLIELLVVIGIIVLMIGALGLALRGGGGNAALQSAQGTVASMVGVARSQAAGNQTVAYLAIDADPTSDTFLRGLHVAVQTAGVWSLVSDTTLPSGVGFVPASGFNPTAVVLAAGWPAARASALQPATITVNNQIYLLTSFSFDATGRLSSGGGDKLVLGPIRRTSATAVSFDNTELIRGVRLSAYGATILVNDAAGFDN